MILQIIRVATHHLNAQTTRTRVLQRACTGSDLGLCRVKRHTSILQSQNNRMLILRLCVVQAQFQRTHVHRWSTMRQRIGERLIQAQIKPVHDINGRTPIAHMLLQPLRDSPNAFQAGWDVQKGSSRRDIAHGYGSQLSAA